MEGPDFQRLLERLRDDWQRLTGAAAWQRVPGAGHYIQRDSPQAVVRAVRELAGAR